MVLPMCDNVFTVECSNVKVELDTALGKLCVDFINTLNPKTAIVSIRKDGEDIDLVAVEVDEIHRCAKAYLWKDTSTDEYTHSHCWTEEEINIE